MAELLGELLDRCRRGDGEAVSAVVRRFAASAHELAAAILNDEHLAEDAVQSAMVAALSRLGQLRCPEAFGAWLRQIVRTQARRLRPRHPSGPSLAAEQAEELSPGPADQARLRELQETVRACLARLPPSARRTAELYYLDERPVAEVAGLLDVPAGTVKRRLYDVRQKLRDMLLGYIGDEAPPPRRADERLPL